MPQLLVVTRSLGMLDTASLAHAPVEAYRILLQRSFTMAKHDGDGRKAVPREAGAGLVGNGLNGFTRNTAGMQYPAILLIRETSWIKTRKKGISLPWRQHTKLPLHSSTAP